MKLSIHNFKISTKIFVGFTMLLIILISAVIVSFRNSNEIIKSENLIIHTHEVLTQIHEIEAKLIDLETGQRGYIITGKEEYLEPYNNSLKIIYQKMNDLKELTSDNPDQTERILVMEQMVDRKLYELNETIQLRKYQGFEVAKEIVDNDSGKLIMDSIRVQIAALEQEELALLDVRSVGPLEAQKKTNSILAMLLVYGFIACIIIGMGTSRTITKPIDSLISSTKKIGKGDLDHKIDISSKDEIGQLSRSFEQMIQNLKQIMATKVVLEKEINTRKEAEKKLYKAKEILEDNKKELLEINQTKDKFFSIIAHDLKSPFTSLLGFSEMLNNRYHELSSLQKKRYIDIIATGIENTYNLLENLLLWSRTQGGQITFKPKKENLYLVSKKALQLQYLAAESKHINFEVNIPVNIDVEMDKDMFETILRNLVSNAIKFTPEKGKIKVEAKFKNLSKNNNIVEFNIDDNGVGIADDVQEKLFSIGETISTKGTKDETGTGLGLYICHDFIKMHGGSIWVKSIVGKGSAFYFTLPNATIEEIEGEESNLVIA